MSRFSRLCTVLCAAVSLTACESAESAPSTNNDGSATLYLASSWVTDAENTNTYIKAFGSLDIERLDFTTALEVPGWADAWVFGGKVFVADGAAPEVTRYKVDGAGNFTEDGKISFANYGVSSAAFWNQEFLSTSKAYLANDAGEEYIVWNPETMQIAGTVAWPELTLEQGQLPFHSYMDRGGVVTNGKFFHGLYNHNEGWDYFGETSVVAVWDVASDKLDKVIEVPCPMMDVASLGEDGYLYVSGWSYIPLSAQLGKSKKNCAARIDTKTMTLDAGWTFDYAAATGKQGSALRVVDGNKGVFALFHGTGVQVTADTGIWDLDAGDNDWELYEIELSTKKLTPTGVKFGDGSYYETHLGGDYYVYLGSGADTQIYHETDSGLVPKVKAAGWLSRLFQLR